MVVFFARSRNEYRGANTTPVLTLRTTAEKQNQLLPKSDSGPILAASFLIPNRFRQFRMHQSLSKATGVLAARPFRGMTMCALYYILFPQLRRRSECRTDGWIPPPSSGRLQQFPGEGGDVVCEQALIGEIHCTGCTNDRGHIDFWRFLKFLVNRFPRGASQSHDDDICLSFKHQAA